MTKHAERLGVEIKGIHKIEKNPEKSKHLETATTNLFGLDIDFVNLRCEEYAGDSRIPTVQFGTPTQDAFRRDATLNALFYNLQEQKIEDFTGRGLQDLKDGLLRTPLDPFETFNEDPLRVLRLIRFSAKYGFPVADGTLRAMGHPEIKQALIRKISRERVGVEVSKMLAQTTKYPEKGLFAIAFLKLEEAIFYVNPESLVGILPSSNLTELTRTARNLEARKVSLHPELQTEFLSDTKHRYSFWLSVPLTQFDGLQALNEKRRPVPAVDQVIREGLKLPLHEGNTVLLMFSLKLKIWEAALAVSSNNISRKHLGLLIREGGEKWKLSVIYSLFWRLSLTPEAEEELFSKYNSLVSEVYKLGLDTAYSIKPLINGKEIMDLFKAKGGSWTARAVESVIEMQLEDPQATKEGLSHKLLEMRSTLLS
jgi:tRNA nucleotidyltransferase (CCA-adding enzyme)